MTSSKIWHLESLRGIAAIAVCLYHFQINSHFSNQFIQNAWIFVDFFFVLSGFVIAINYQNKLLNFKNIYRFQFNRFLRLYPLHISMLIIFLGIEIAKYLAEVNFGLIANNIAFSINNLSSFLSNIFLLQNFTHNIPTWNKPSWSISAEFFTYFIFALVIFITKSQRKKIITVSILISIISAIYLFNQGMNSSNGVVRCLLSFFLGVLTYNIFFKLNKKITLTSSFLSFSIIALTGFILIRIENELDKNALFILLFFAFTVASLALTSKECWIVRLLSNKFFVMLGTLSYGIYMIHSFVWWVFMQILRIGFNFPTQLDNNGNNIVIVENIFIGDAFMLIGLGAIILLSFLSYKFIEMPANKVKYNL